MRCAMTDASAATEIDQGRCPPDTQYRHVQAAYNTALRRAFGAAVTTTRKWQDEDLRWPHSDLDLRVLLGQPPDDWIEFNDALAQAHRALVAATPLRRRVLEHPPGWIYFRDELARSLVPAAELVTWSATSDADVEAVAGWRSATTARPWSVEDMRFYSAILRSRVNGRYRLAADSAANIVIERDRYGPHCVLWHFLAPVVFACTALSTRTRPPGKTAAMAAHPDLAVRKMLRRSQAGYGDVPDTPALLDCVRRLVDAQIPRTMPTDLTPPPTAAEVVGAIGVLRCRAGRYGYYLDPPAGVSTGYLVDRESKDLHAATDVLAAAIPQLPVAMRSLVRRFLAMVPPPPTTVASLAGFLHRLRGDRGLLRDLFGLPEAELGVL